MTEEIARFIAAHPLDVIDNGEVMLAMVRRRFPSASNDEIAEAIDMATDLIVDAKLREMKAGGTIQ